MKPQVPVEQVTIAILSYRRPAALAACLSSLFEHTPLVRVEILNQGYLNDALRRLYADLAARPQVRVRYGDRNIGCAAGRKLLFEQVETPYVFYADDDLVFTPGWLEPLLTTIEAHPEAGAVSPIVVSRRGFLGAGRMTLQGGCLQLRDHCSTEIQAMLTDFLPCDYLPGGAVLMRQRVLAEVIHDPQYFIGWEDVDLFLQMRQTSWKAGLCLYSRVLNGKRRWSGLDGLSYDATRWDAKALAASRRHLLAKWGLTRFECVNATPTFGDRHPWLRRFGRPLKILGRRALKRVLPWMPWE